jgi:hypothetical protein
LLATTAAGLSSSTSSLELSIDFAPARGAMLSPSFAAGSTSRSFGQAGPDARGPHAASKTISNSERTLLG